MTTGKQGTSKMKSYQFHVSSTMDPKQNKTKQKYTNHMFRHAGSVVPTGPLHVLAFERGDIQKQKRCKYFKKII